jgi:hypothetical protein
MANWKVKTEEAFKVITYGLVLSLVLVSFWASNWRLTAEIDAVLLFLIAYTLLLILPFSRFKLGLSGFEGELGRLVEGAATAQATTDTTREVDREVADFSEEVVDNDSVLIRLAIEIETTLRNIAKSSGLTVAHVGMGQLIQMLRRREILTDKWLLNALHFFQVHRNELIHEGRTDDIRNAIDVGKGALAQLREIQQRVQGQTRLTPP